MIKKSFGTVHCCAYCLDCDWHEEDYLTARDKALQHAKSHGHKVDVDIGIEGWYDGRSCSSTSGSSKQKRT